MTQEAVDYDVLVNDLASKLVYQYGSVAEFTRHKDFLDLGFTLNDSDKVQTYFAKTKGGKRKTKSAKVMVVLAKKFLGRNIEVKTEVKKVQYLFEQVGE